MKTIREYKRELLVYLIGCLVLDGIYLLLMFLFGRMSPGVLIGLTLGTVLSILNFISLFFTRPRVLSKPEGAKRRYGMYYFARLLLIGVFYVLIFQIPGVSILSAALPIIYPKLIYYTLAIAGRGDLI